MLQRFYKDGLICFKYYFFIKTLADIYILSSYFYGPQRINFTLDFLYGSQQVVSQEWKFIPNNKNPTKTNVTTSHDSFLRLDRDSRQISQGNIFYFPISPSQKPWSSHKCILFSNIPFPKTLELPQMYFIFQYPLPKNPGAPTNVVGIFSLG
jgi:hypothetical protein